LSPEREERLATPPPPPPPSPCCPWVVVVVVVARLLLMVHSLITKVAPSADDDLRGARGGVSIKGLIKALVGLLVLVLVLVLVVVTRRLGEELQARHEGLIGDKGEVREEGRLLLALVLTVLLPVLGAPPPLPPPIFGVVVVVALVGVPIIRVARGRHCPTWSNSGASAAASGLFIDWQLVGLVGHPYHIIH